MGGLVLNDSKRMHTPFLSFPRSLSSGYDEARLAGGLFPVALHNPYAAIYHYVLPFVYSMDSWFTELFSRAKSLTKVPIAHVEEGLIDI